MLYPRPTDREFARRHAAARREMRRHRLDCLVVYGGYQDMYQQNGRYLSGYTDLLHFYVVLPRESEPTLLIHSGPQLSNARSVSAIADTRWGGVAIAESVVERILELGVEHGRIGIVGIETARNISIPVEHWQTLEAGLPGAELTVATSIVEDLRRRKSPAEIRLLRRGAALTDRAMMAAAELARPGRREFEVVAAMRCRAWRDGGSPSFAYLHSSPMVAPTGSFPSFAPSTRRLRSRDVLLAETAVAYAGYSGGVGRTMTLGAPTAAISELHDIALEVYRRFAVMLKPGVSSTDLVEAARPISDSGLIVQGPVLKGWDNHIELPWVGVPDDPAWVTTEHVFQRDEVVVIAPNPTTSDRGTGVFFANLHIITDGGNECLQDSPVELLTLPVSGTSR